VTGAARSLVLITVDCLRADHVGFMGYGRPTTPFLDSLAAESFVVPTAIVSGAPTFYSFPGIMASLGPLALGRDVVGIAPGECTLASVFKEHGYATAAFIAANPYLSPRFGYDAGFDRFQDFGNAAEVRGDGIAGSRQSQNRINQALQTFSRRYRPLADAYDELYFEYCQRIATAHPESLDALRRYPASDVLVGQAKEWIRSVGGQPFFLWLHLMDPHAPYYPPQEALALMGDEHLSDARAQYWNSYWNRGEVKAAKLKCHQPEVLALYDAGIRWVDKQVESLISDLRNIRRWDDCALAFTADHGEEFLDHGGRYHPPSNLKEEIIHVPLLLRIPQSPKCDVPAAPFSHLDLGPTILEALQLQSPSTFQGQSRWMNLQTGTSWDGAAVVESVGSCTNPYDAHSRIRGRTLAVREQQYKLLIDFDQGRDELFDLSMDPEERNPLPGDSAKSARARLLRCVRQHLQRPLHPEHSPLRLAGRLHELRLELGQFTN
jgi:arylsulfatase A-like enzyme